MQFVLLAFDFALSLSTICWLSIYWTPWSLAPSSVNPLSSPCEARAGSPIGRLEYPPCPLCYSPHKLVQLLEIVEFKTWPWTSNPPPCLYSTVSPITSMTFLWHTLTHLLFIEVDKVLAEQRCNSHL